MSRLPKPIGLVTFLGVAIAMARVDAVETPVLIEAHPTELEVIYRCLEKGRSSDKTLPTLSRAEVSAFVRGLKLSTLPRSQDFLVFSAGAEGSVVSNWRRLKGGQALYMGMGNKPILLPPEESGLPSKMPSKGAYNVEDLSPLLKVKDPLEDQSAVPSVLDHRELKAEVVPELAQDPPTQEQKKESQGEEKPVDIHQTVGPDGSAQQLIGSGPPTLLNWLAAPVVAALIFDSKESVPEPGTVAALTLGALALVGRRRKR